MCFTLWKIRTILSSDLHQPQHMQYHKICAKVHKICVVFSWELSTEPSGWVANTHLWYWRKTTNEENTFRLVRRYKHSACCCWRLQTGWREKKKVNIIHKNNKNWNSSSGNSNPNSVCCAFTKQMFPWRLLNDAHGIWFLQMSITNANRHTNTHAHVEQHSVFCSIAWGENAQQ